MSREFSGEQGNPLPGREGKFRRHRVGSKENHLIRSSSREGVPSREWEHVLEVQPGEFRSFPREGVPSRDWEHVLEGPRVREAAQERAVREKIGEARRGIEAALKAGEAAALDKLYRDACELGYIEDPGPR